ncbi:MAG: malate dehydrogenase [Thermofilum sp. ex4484_79]|nr:MAG: malate dehydrogenase [Thermofilum sp. ex4484_79]
MEYEYYEREKPVPPEDYVRVDHVMLRDYVTSIFERLGVFKWNAEVVADVLVTADLFGISSHGVQRVRRYVDGIRSGNIDIHAEPKIIIDRGAIAVIDACNGLGQPVSVRAMELAIKKAHDYGVSLVLVRRSNHFGIAGYYSLKAAERGYIGVTMTNSVNLVAYTNTVERIIGTNPIAVAVPKLEPPPILFDAATSVVPVGKIEIYAKQGKKIPSGWVIDRKGNILHGDAAPILKKIKTHEAALLPLGGLGEEHGGHKGSGLSFVIDIISGVLSGAAWGLHVGYTVGKKPSNVGHAFIAIDIEAFMSREEFNDRINRYVMEIKSSKKHPKADRIWIPGEKAWLTMETRKKIGIPLHKNVYKELTDIGMEVGVETTLKNTIDCKNVL